MNKQRSKPFHQPVSRRFLISSALPVLLLSGCKKTQIEIRGGGFRNLTDLPIKDVELRVPANNKLVSCSYITPGGFFSTVIPVRAYEHNEIIVKWTYRGIRMKSGPFKIELPDPLPSEPVVAVVRFYSSGKAEAQFIPLSKVPARYMGLIQAR